MRGLVIGVVASTVALLHGSCSFETKTTLCGTSGLRCPQGWVCSAAQDACIEVGTCGDRVIDGDEACDDGNRADGDGCSADCTSDESCGNGKVDAIREEVEDCDDGNNSNTDGCPDGPGGTCEPARCGDGFIRASVEQCEQNSDCLPGLVCSHCQCS